MISKRNIYRGIKKNKAIRKEIKKNEVRIMSGLIQRGWTKKCKLMIKKRSEKKTTGKKKVSQ